MVKSDPISQEVLDILSSAQIVGDILKLTCGQLDRKTYLSVNKVLKALGGKWNSTIKAHVFPEDPTHLIHTALATKSVVDKQKMFQMYCTPPKIVSRLIGLADLQPGDLVLEPSAGTGNILVNIPGGKVVGEHVYRQGRVHYCEIQMDLLEKLRSFATPVGNDFLLYKPGPIYDKIIANPPFAKQQDVKHVSHMIDCCKPGGRVVAVMSTGFTFRQNSVSVEFRKKMEGCKSHDVIELGAGEFRDSGTMVNTAIVRIDK